ncbi:MAG: RNA-guided pseudouridylation complex pseudouridine synthase subunit Cbf5 [Candidatus Aenigmatarchaeota archaeon]|nr:MAG: RNA-guided pseudouridylation complex pseudouridine synthase subunit Cbf5 [Candidatus Aenigmarchaeota archaeon]
MSLEKLLNRSVILIDKPKGPTSFDMVEKVSGMLKVKKAGHSGTLDPNATGLLVIGLGESRKAMPVLTGLDKEYTGVMELHSDVTRKEVEKVLKEFVGEIIQTPPVKSAVARKPRKRRVYEIEVTEKLERTVKFRVLCEAGTYVRLIAHEAGEKLGCGAHLKDLRRTRVGPFKVEHSIQPVQLKKMSGNTLRQILIPLEEALNMVNVPRIVIKSEHEKLVRNGSPVRRGFVKKVYGKAENGDDIVVFSESGTAVCLAKYVSEGDNVAKTDRVFLE